MKSEDLSSSARSQLRYERQLEQDKKDKEGARFSLDPKTIAEFKLRPRDLWDAGQTEPTIRVDYVKENKSYVLQYNEKLELMIKYNKMVLNAQNQKQVREANEMIIQFHREDTIQKSKKWENFREARLVMMDKYI